MKGLCLSICAGLVLAVPVAASCQEYVEVPMDPFIVWADEVTPNDGGVVGSDPVLGPPAPIDDLAVPEGGVPVGGSAIPEPATLSLLAVGGLALLRWRRT